SLNLRFKVNTLVMSLVCFFVYLKIKNSLFKCMDEETEKESNNYEVNPRVGYKPNLGILLWTNMQLKLN
ncbi:hypothetical protein A3P64_08010, partial [Lactobacillus johnsonii]